MSKISKGFVVTELAIAIVILGILSAVIAPIAYKATMNARASSEGDAVSNYLADLTLKAQPPYTMVTTQWAIDAGISLADYTSGSDVINMFGNYIHLGMERYLVALQMELCRLPKMYQTLRVLF